MPCLITFIIFCALVYHIITNYTITIEPASVSRDSAGVSEPLMERHSTNQRKDKMPLAVGDDALLGGKVHNATFEVLEKLKE